MLAPSSLRPARVLRHHKVVQRFAERRHSLEGERHPHVVLQVSADAGQIAHDVDAEVGEVACGPIPDRSRIIGDA